MKRQNLRAFVTMGALATSLLVSSTATAAVDMFLKLGDIKGESQDSKHKDAIDVLAWSWGESSGSAQVGRGTVPKTCIQDVSFTKYIDSASPDLIMTSMLGQVIPTAVLSIEKAGGNSPGQEYIRLTMKNVRVTSYSTGGSGGEDRLTENTTLHFESMQFQYQKLNSDGQPDGPPLAFDVVAGNSAGCR